MSDHKHDNQSSSSLLGMLKIFPLIAFVLVIAYAALPQLFRLDVIDWRVMLKWSGKLTAPLMKGEGVALLTSPLLLSASLSILTGLLFLFTRRLRYALFALLIGALALAPVYSMKKLRDTAASVPPIHDITTNWEDPPVFVALAGKRVGASNPDAYDPGQTERQKQAFPDIGTYISERSVEEVFKASEATLKSMGLKIISADSEAGQIEATYTSKWFAFKDDVIVRIRPGDSVTMLDIRSKSRVGGSDVGANSRRIREFLTKLDAGLK